MFTGWYEVVLNVKYVLTEKSNKMQQCIKILLFLVLNEAQHVSGETPPIIRSLKLHKQPLVLHNTVEGCRTCSCWTKSGFAYVVGCRTCSCWTLPDNVQKLHVRQPTTYAKPEADCAVLGY